MEQDGSSNPKHDAETVTVQLEGLLYFGLPSWKDPNRACMYGLAAYIGLYCKSIQQYQLSSAMQCFWAASGRGQGSCDPYDSSCK